MKHGPEVRRICATAYLDHVRSLRMRIDALQEEIEPLREMVGTAMDYRERVSGSPNPKAFEDAVIKLQDLIADYCTEMAEFVDELLVARSVVRGLSRPGYRTAIELHYIDGTPWTIVCEVMGYTKDGMMTLRRKAVDEVYDLMPEQWRREPIPNAAA